MNDDDRGSRRRQRRAVSWLAAAVVAVGIAAGARGADDWPQFRGPGGLAKSPAAAVPAEWSATKNVVWKTQLPGAGTSSPIVVAGRIYLTCFSGYGVPRSPEGDMAELKRTLLCLDAASGRILWQREMKVALPEQPRPRDNHGYVSNTPVSDGKSLYVFCGKSGVFAFDMTGRAKWHAEVGSGLSGWGSAASPILFENLLIVNASVESRSLVALDAKTGKQAWRVGDIKEAWNTPALVGLKGGKTELIVAVPRKVIGLDPATGQQLWTCDTGITWYMVPSMVSHEGVVYCIGGRSGAAGSLAVRAGGRGDVTATHRLWKTPRRSNVSSPVYHEGHLYFAHEQRAMAICLDAKTGKVVYEEKLGRRAGQVYSSPVLAGGRLYYVTRRGGTFVVPAKPTFEVLAHNSLDDRSTFNASPAVTGDRLLLRSDAYLYCLGEK